MGTKTDDYQVTAQDVADILAGTLNLLKENGLSVGVRPSAEKPGRAAGLLIYVSAITVADDGKLEAIGDLD